jgi:hypothetical protein
MNVVDFLPSIQGILSMASSVWKLEDPSHVCDLLLHCNVSETSELVLETWG